MNTIIIVIVTGGVQLPHFCPWPPKKKRKKGMGLIKRNKLGLSIGTPYLSLLPWVAGICSTTLGSMLSSLVTYRSQDVKVEKLGVLWEVSRSIYLLRFV